MNIKKNLIVAKNDNRPFLLDYYYLSSKHPKPIVLFIHGFKGFKDWGHWELIAKEFAHSGFVFIKFNLSHNGTTIDDPYNFADLDAFGQNNYSLELSDIDQVLEWLQHQKLIEQQELQLDQISLIGHSRGGGIGIIKAAADSRIKRLITWAAVSRLDYSWRMNESLIEKWKTEGVRYIMNGRTKQNMPLFFQLHEDFVVHESAFDIEAQLASFRKPFLIVHGSNDPAVSVAMAQELKSWAAHAELFLIPEANHVFGGSHPYTLESLPLHAQIMVDKSIQFLKEKILD